MSKAIRMIAATVATATALAVVTAASGGTAFAAVGAPSFSRGASGFNVYCAQEAVYEQFHGTVAAPDGDFGPVTYSNVVKFQQALNLQPNGEVGPLTGTQMWLIIQRNDEYFNGDFQTPWGVPMDHCYQVLPTSS